MSDNEPIQPKVQSGWIPLGVGLLVFGGGTWFWVANAYALHQVPSFLWAFSIAFLGTAAMRKNATVRNDYINLLAPILAFGSTAFAIYTIRIASIRQMYAQRGMPDPGWWNGSDTLRHLLTQGGSNQGKLELAVMLTASLAGLVCASSLVRRKDE